MATTVSKPSLGKWFSNNKSFRISFERLYPSKSDLSSRNFSLPKSELIATTTTPRSTPRDRSRKDELREVFGYFDTDGDGKISAHELRSYFASIGEYISLKEAQGVINDLDADGDNLINLEDFMKLMEREGGHDEDLRRAFEMFEVEKGSGCITPKGLQKMFRRLGDEISHEECKAMIKIFDVDGDGVLGFHEFQQMMA
ncbi:probable calcium-binding protein CML41 [Telopea speciosissima]|uniref:probable calcium-binding protein CML41 n=1 Tax=Telopea speciosissima TaxID=54955 RepID=UPI001CC5B727|nr:probable calcium-binding protein CML41 [Telopea speciosissima]XP_043712398.1 probable calcium-binding protein CML41 [Telopea speciosissima]